MISKTKSDKVHFTFFHLLQNSSITVFREIMQKLLVNNLARILRSNSLMAHKPFLFCKMSGQYLTKERALIWKAFPLNDKSQ